MTEFRWLKGNWEFGKFKLQYRLTNMGALGVGAMEWEDVPTVEDKPAEKSLQEKFKYWLEHNNYGISHNAEVLATMASEHFKKQNDNVS